MPLVRISFRKGRQADFGERAGTIVYEAMVETIAVPRNDRFQIITEHDERTLVYDPGYLDIRRSDGIIVIQITLSEGRSVERKRSLYKRIAERLNAELGVRVEDVFINLVEVKKENWSFGNGVAQYVTQERSPSEHQV
jgi:phenylpyruvate tautomerase PptA (4-oxalocrotonate tautomerase family)